VHRAHFLDNLVKSVSEGITHFSKHVDTIEELSNGQLKLMFHDGTAVTADAVIGCDGVKSQVRAWMVGEDHPSAHPSYTHKYAYRGLIPMDRARKELGDDLALNSKMHMGQDGHMLTFPVDHGATMNIVAFKVDPGEWPSSTKLTLPSKKEDVYNDFTEFGATVLKIIDLLEPQLDRWAIFDTGSHPMPFYNKGKVVVIGDAGHATSPHHGAGAGMCIEDAAILAELIVDPRVAENGDKGIAAAFKAYSEQRLERTQWLVQSSRRSGDLYELRAEGVGRDISKIEEECRWRDEKIWNGQVSKYIQEAKEFLGKALN
jgi:salicylate hydroxylase